MPAKRKSAASPESTEGFIPPNGGYEQLISFQKARVIYDGTVWFCRRFVDPRSRATDQMVQAARSGKQNILEGSEASATSKEMEINLTNEAKASLGELLEDYRDFLHIAKEPAWDKNCKEALYVRQKSREDLGVFQEFFETRPGPVVANIQICLIH
jgi:four helix bundle protein